MPEEIFTLDVDFLPKPWWDDWLKTRKAILEALGLKFKRVIKKPSQNRALHVWIYAESPIPLTDMQKVKINFLLGDDPVRSRINYRRVRRGVKRFWEKIFYHKHKLKPLPKRCQKCRIRRAIDELAAEDELWLR